MARVAPAAGGGERISPGRAHDLDLGSTGGATWAGRGGDQRWWGSHRLQASGAGDSIGSGTKKGSKQQMPPGIRCLQVRLANHKPVTSCRGKLDGRKRGATIC
jgi:hypothetical protein